MYQCNQLELLLRYKGVKGDLQSKGSETVKVDSNE